MEKNYGQFNSWFIQDDNTIFKKCDKTFLNSGISGVPIKIRWFFGVENIQSDERVDYILMFEDVKYEANIKCDALPHDQTKLHLNSELLNNLKKAYKKWDESLVCCFKREGDNIFSIRMEKYKEMANKTTCVYDKNTILFGPPGTGKTYNSAAYAVGICDKTPRKELDDYIEIMRRYNELKKAGRIEFTTFHQSYGYEEFIEGISPVIEEEQDSTNSDNIGYKYKDGIFKEFCKRAEKDTFPKLIETKKDISIWCITLGGRSTPELKKICYDEGTIRISCTDVDESVQPEEEDTTTSHKNTFIQFKYKMKPGDLVLVYKDASTFDAIGRVTGEYESNEIQTSYYFDRSGIIDQFPRYRKVEWLVKDQDINMSDISSNIRFTSSYILSELSTVEETDVLKAVNNIRKKKTLPYVFIIDEINRGNISKIFGELITLIEPSKRAGNLEAASVKLPYSGEIFSVPDNVYILGTMNTADRSIALMDTALRRRFRFMEQMPDVELLKDVIVEQDGKSLNIGDMLEVINKRIQFLYDREHTIGHAYFMTLKENPSMEQLSDIFTKSVIPLLQEYFYEDYQKIQLVLGDNGKTKDQEELKFIRDIPFRPEELFVGDVEDMIDLPEKTYEINREACCHIESYKAIAPNL